MALQTVRVPEDFEEAFRKAEELVSRFFRERIDDPRHGTIEIFGERYVLVRAASLSVEFFTLVEDLFGADRRAEANVFARNILFDLAHAIGRSDAQNFHAKMGLDDPIAKLSAGPIHFAHAGWAFVDIHGASKPTPDESFCLIYDHPYSFESDAWLRAGTHRDFPVCIMNAGYSSGWCEASFGVKLVSCEVLCRAKGDACCRFIMAHPDRIEATVARYVAERPELATRVHGYDVPAFFARKRIEDELRRSHDELERRVAERTAELMASRDRLEREIEERQQAEAKLRHAHKLEAIGRLAGGIAHDFNNLLAVILTHAALLQRRIGPDDRAYAELESIRSAADRAALMTKQLLAFAKAQVVSCEPVDLNAAIGELARTLLPLLGEDVELVTELAPELATIEADRGQIGQVILNLTVNARDAMPRGGRLNIATTMEHVEDERPVTSGLLAAGDHVVLRVSDSGIGIDEALLPMIFDPFFTTKPDGQGTGLGLSTVYGIVRQLRGAISVTTMRNVGTTFALYFPRSERTSRVASIRRADEIPCGTETVLLVEDQDALRAAVEEVLRSCGYVVLGAADPTCAVEIAERHSARIHLLLTDVVLPKMRGYELAKRMHGRRPEMRVLFMSGYANDVAFDKEVADGAVALLQKPFLPEQLARKVREVLDAPELEGEATAS